MVALAGGVFAVSKLMGSLLLDLRLIWGKEVSFPPNHLDAFLINPLSNSRHSTGTTVGGALQLFFLVFTAVL